MARPTKYSDERAQAICIDWASLYEMDAWPVVPHWIDRLARLYQRREMLRRHAPVDAIAAADMARIDGVILGLERSIHTLVYGATDGPPDQIL